MNQVQLITGQQVDSASEAWRHECEARYVIELPTDARRRAYLDGVAAKRGQDAMAALEDTARAVLAAINRHAHT